MFTFGTFARLFGRHAGTPYERGVRELAAGRVEAALAMFDDILATEPDAATRAKVENKRGVAFMRAGNVGNAQAAFERSLAAVPHFAPALTNLGNVALEAGDVARAIERYESAIRSDESYALAYFNLSVAYKREGRIAEGAQALRRATKLEGRAFGKQRGPR